MIANESGSGLIRAIPLARRFVDLAGLSLQRIAEWGDRVEFRVVGVPLVLKRAALESPQ